MNFFRLVHIALIILTAGVATAIADIYYTLTLGFLTATFLFFMAALTATDFIASLLSNNSQNRSHLREMEALTAESIKLGFDSEDVKMAKYSIRSYLTTHPASTTADIFKNVGLPPVFTDSEKAVEAFRLGGLIGICRYGQDPTTKKWYNIRDSQSVRKQYRRFQRYIKSRAYRQDLRAR
jgi:hypothetical protein